MALKQGGADSQTLVADRMGRGSVSEGTVGSLTVLEAGGHGEVGADSARWPDCSAITTVHFSAPLDGGRAPQIPESAPTRTPASPGIQWSLTYPKEQAAQFQRQAGMIME